MTNLNEWCSDVLFRLRGPLRGPTDVRILTVPSEQSRSRVLEALGQSPRLVVSYPDEALSEDTVPDEDCTLRHATLEGGTVHSPTLLTYHRLNATSGKPIPKFPIAIDFRGPAGSYPALSENPADLRSLSREALSQSIILVGRDAGSDRLVRTPFGPLSPLEAQANVLETLWQGRALSAVPRWFTRVATLATIALSVLVLMKLPLTYAWMPLLGLAGAWIFAGWICLYQAKVILALANPLVGILVSHLLLLGYKVRKQEAEHWESQREAETGRQVEEFKNNFVSLFSHDLKTPIARIKAVVKLALSNEGVPPALQDSLKNIDRASDDLGRLISDILKITKMESMSLEMQKDAVDVNRMVEMAVARLKFAAEEKKIRFVLDLEPLFPIEGDPTLIQEIILNLAENAVKYGRPDTEVLLRTSEEPGRVRVTVTDKGLGIPADELPRVAGKFYRGKEASQSTSGSGLGLYLAKYFVELHQGELEIKSQPGRGTEVSFWLPSPN